MSKPINLKRSIQPKASCSDCSLLDLCFARDVAESRREELDRIIKRERPLHRDQHLFHAGQTLNSICVVRSGMVKSYQILPDGDEMVTGFHLPGELVGLDAIGHERHPAFAVALEDSHYCEFPYRDFHRILDDNPDLNHLVLQLLSADMAEMRELLLVVNRMEARARVAVFLLNLSRRLGRRGHDPYRFRLAMDRRDIANYLGLTIETVSRTLSAMQKKGLISVHGKRLSLLNVDDLFEMAGPEHHELLIHSG
ncbi:MAG: fumarate/nitrate reduction transcriptional regulator Fnr [Pseudomonadota bacterium]